MSIVFYTIAGVLIVVLGFEISRSMVGVGDPVRINPPCDARGHIPGPGYAGRVGVVQEIVSYPNADIYFMVYFGIGCAVPFRCGEFKKLSRAEFDAYVQHREVV